jgi:hypothetical protein
MEEELDVAIIFLHERRKMRQREGYAAVLCKQLKEWIKGAHISEMG